MFKIYLANQNNMTILYWLFSTGHIAILKSCMFLLLKRFYPFINSPEITFLLCDLFRWLRWLTWNFWKWTQHFLCHEYSWKSTGNHAVVIEHWSTTNKPVLPIVLLALACLRGNWVCLKFSWVSIRTFSWTFLNVKNMLGDLREKSFKRA